MEYIIDAKDKSLGRVASESALILRGKKTAEFAPHRIPNLKLKIKNVNEIKISEKKTNQKKYTSHSGYPGGLKIKSLDKILKEKGMVYVLQKTILGMIPKNRLRKKIMKNLILE